MRKLSPYIKEAVVKLWDNGNKGNKAIALEIGISEWSVSGIISEHLEEKGCTINQETTNT